MQNKISKTRKVKDGIANFSMYFASGAILLLLALIIGYILFRGLPNITLKLLTTKPGLIRETVGMLPNILNTV